VPPWLPAPRQSSTSLIRQGSTEQCQFNTARARADTSVLRSAKRLALVLIVAVLVGLALDAGQQFYWRSRPASAFTSLVGKLPSQISAQSYGSCITDTFFRRTHYWRLKGDASNLRELAHRLGYVRTDQDALSMLPKSKKCLDPLLSRHDVVESYEHGASRNHWYYLVRGEREALLAF
jgi:hypothetical protein